MSETRFTPGPWGIHRRVSTLVESASGRSVATSGGHFTTTETDGGLAENEANARLIAAAPALYAALSKFVEWCDLNDWGTVPDALEQSCRAALSQARGEQP